MNLVLIGYRATGKTTVARILAEKLGWEAIDADVEIEARAGKTIALIFAEDGEPAFRDLETEVVRDLLARDQLILSAGGGAPLREENREAMRTRGTVVWLVASPETIVSRMSADVKTADQRPALTEKGPLEEVLDVLRVREPIYREAAHETVDTEGKSPEAVADEIIERLSLM